MVLVSLGVFANSAMYYNELNKEAEVLRQTLDDLYEVRAELIADLGSAEELQSLLEDYRECNEVLNSGSVTADVLKEYQEKLEEVRNLLNSSKNRDYIAKIAKEELGLYFADEEIFYNDINK